MTAEYDEITAHQHAIRQVIPLLEAMRSVAEIAFRHAEARLPPLTRYASSIDAQLADLDQVPDGPLSSPPNASSGSVVVVVSTERGLCGAFNQRLVEQVRVELSRRRSAGEEIALVCLGHQGCRLLEAAGETIVHRAPLPSFGLPTYLDIEKMAIEVIDLMEGGNFGRLLVMSNAPRRRFRYEFTDRRLFPFEPVSRPSDGLVTPPEIKPASDTENLFTHLLTERVLIDLYQAVIESAISEELARVAAMRLATDNARHLLEQLTIDSNRARQASQTNALLEIISGFQAASETKSGRP